ncbi:MAG: proline dehydrogenase family protein [Prevotellaceae bacterium]|nr:proline dehydrogenase family protein [Prevotellaceae bacterium]
MEKSKGELNTSIMLFKAVRYKWLVKFGRIAVPHIIWIPGMKSLIKKTVFRQFCGGETLDETQNVVKSLAKHHVNAISDYSAEQADTREKQEEAKKNILASIGFAGTQQNVPFACVKITGICARPLLEKISRGDTLSEEEAKEKQDFHERLDVLCSAANEQGKKMFIDAEETWINPAINEAAEMMMAKYNKERHVVYTTIQFYTVDAVSYLQRLIDDAPYKVALKLVRGAYHEQENERAAHAGYPTPILPGKVATDESYNAGLRLCMAHLDKVSFCAATHNVDSINLLIALMNERNISADSHIISFSQLYGMRDNLTFGLASEGYNVSKYVPYGPLKEVIPYLIRRAEENSGIGDQMSEELQMLQRAKKAKNAKQEG